MTDDDSRNPVEELAEQFVERRRRGERPTVTEYVEHYPQWAADIREVFPALLMVEDAKPLADDTGGLLVGVSVTSDGTRLEQLGDYRILREAGRGGMGVVYEAEQESLGRHVAVKVLPAHAMLNPKYLHRFEREARAAGRLHHTNIVPVFGVGEQDGLHYYVMQFIQGLGLDEVFVELRRLRRSKRNASHESVGRSDSQAESRGQTQLSAADVALALVSGHFHDPRAMSSGADTSGHEAVELHSQDAAGATEGQASDRSSRSLDTFVRSNLDAAETGSDSPVTSSDVTLPGDSNLSAASQSGRHYWHSVARIGVQVADALDYAHANGTLHRDIKPSNLMLDTDGTAWVTDFGLAKLDEEVELTHTGDIVGTLRYMAPERFHSESDGRSDIYSLGLTLYELITLEPAFRHANRQQVIQRVTQQQIPRPRKIDPQIPRDLETIVLKAIDRDPAVRYQTAGDLRRDLERFLDDRSIEARQASPPERLWRWGRRNPAVACLTSTVAVLLLAVAVVSFLFSLRLSEKHGDMLANLERAMDAEHAARVAAVREREARELATWRLFDASLATSDAVRSAGQMGQRFISLNALAEAAKLVPTLNLPAETQLAVRNRAIESLSLIDLRVDRAWPGLVSDRSRIAFDPQVERYARLEAGGDIIVRNVTDNSQSHRVPALGGRQKQPYLRFSPNGQFLAVKEVDPSSGQLVVQVWDLESSEMIFRSPVGGHDDDKAIDFAPDNRHLAMNVPNGNVCIYDLKTSQRLVEVPTDLAANCLCFSPTGRKLAYAVTSAVYVQEVDAPIQTDSLQVSEHEAASIAWSDDERLIVTASSDRGVHIWDAQTRRLLVRCDGHKAAVDNVAVNPSGDLIASTGLDHTTRLWSSRTGQQLLVAPGRMQRFSRDGRWLAFRYADGQVGRWEVAAGRERRVVRSHSDKTYVSGLSFMVRGQLLASAGGDGVRLSDLRSGLPLASLPTLHANSLTWLPHDDYGKGPILITSGVNGVDFWPAWPSGRTLEVDEPTRLLKQRCTVARASADGRVLAVAVQDDGVAVFDLADRSERLRLNCDAAVYDLAVSPDASWIVTTPHDGGFANVWDVNRGESAGHLPVASQARLDFSRDGRWLLTNDVRQCVVWETDSWNAAHRIDKPSGRSGPIAISDDGSLVAAALDSRRVTLLALTVDDLPNRPTASRRSVSLHVVGVLEAPESGTLHALEFSDEPKSLAIGTSNGLVHVWDLACLQTSLAGIGMSWSSSVDASTNSAAEVVAAPGWRVALQSEMSPTPGPEDKLGQKQLSDLERRTKRIEASPNEPGLYTWRGNTFARLGRKREAEADYRRARELASQRIEQDAADSDAYSARGYANLMLKKYEAAVADFDRRVELTPADIDALYWRGSAHWALGNDDEVVADFRRFTQVRRDIDKSAVQDAHRRLREIHAKRLDYAEELRDLERAVRIRGGGGNWELYRAWALNRLAWVFITAPEELRDLEKAIRYAQESVALAPDKAGYINTLGIVQYRLGDWELAIATLEKAVRTARSAGDEPTAFDFLFLSMSFAQLGHLENARKYLEQGIQWIDQQESLSNEWTRELTEFRQEAQDLISSKVGQNESVPSLSSPTDEEGNS